MGSSRFNHTIGYADEYTKQWCHLWGSREHMKLQSPHTRLNISLSLGQVITCRVSHILTLNNSSVGLKSALSFLRIRIMSWVSARELGTGGGRRGKATGRGTRSHLQRAPNRIYSYLSRGRRRRVSEQVAQPGHLSCSRIPCRFPRSDLPSALNKLPTSVLAPATA
jgi:hypothetical protein